MNFGDREGIIAESSGFLVRTAQLGGVLAFFCGIYNLFRMFDPRIEPVSSLVDVIFFFVIAYFTLVMVKGKEIRLDKANGTVEYTEKSALSKKASKKYLVSQVKYVDYYRQQYKALPWIMLVFRDGTRIECECDDYTPKSSDFAGAEVRYPKHGILTRLKIS